MTKISNLPENYSKPKTSQRVHGKIRMFYKTPLTLKKF